MYPKLVFLHIPKAAGTSHRMYLASVYGEENIFWYGLHSDAKKFDADEIASVPVVGGHRKLDFYPPGLDALYTAVVRNPVERAVSFFNYCTAPLSGVSPKWRVEHEKWLEKWRKEKGMCHYSLSKSIENCKEFRKQVSNFQCDYLSRHGATFKGVLKTLKDENMVIGIFDQMSHFNDFFKNELMFYEENKVQANAGRMGYSSGILEEPGIIELVEEINKEDLALYYFVSKQCGGLYTKATNLNEVRGRVPVAIAGSNFEQSLGQFDWSTVHLFSKGIVGLVPDSAAEIPVVVHNGSAHRIVFSETGDRMCAIGWQFQNRDYKDIVGVNGICNAKTIVRSGESKLVNVEIKVDEAQLLNENPGFVEFYIVDNDSWVREKFPLSSSWARLHAR